MAGEEQPAWIINTIVKSGRFCADTSLYRTVQQPRIPCICSLMIALFFFPRPMDIRKQHNPPLSLRWSQIQLLLPKNALREREGEDEAEKMNMSTGRTIYCQTVFIVSPLLYRPPCTLLRNLSSMLLADVCLCAHVCVCLCPCECVLQAYIHGYAHMHVCMNSFTHVCWWWALRTRYYADTSVHTYLLN